MGFMLDMDMHGMCMENNMILSFRFKATKRLFERTPTRRLPVGVLHAARRKPLWCNAARSLDDLRRPPGWSLDAPGRVFDVWPVTAESGLMRRKGVLPQ